MRTCSRKNTGEQLPGHSQVSGWRGQWLIGVDLTALRPRPVRLLTADFDSSVRADKGIPLAC